MVVATGFFDGVHLGHRLVLERLVAASRSRGEKSAVVTFWPHPRNVLQDDARNLRLLTSLSEKKELIENLGVDKVEVLPFTRAFSRLTTREYLEEYVAGRFGGTAILLGYDNRIGSDLLGPDKIKEVAEGLGLDVIMTDCLSVPGGVVVSSTKIREAISSGDVVSASKMLGYKYSLTGVVVAGNRIGRTIGFPTARLSKMRWASAGICTESSPSSRAPSEKKLQLVPSPTTLKPCSSANFAISQGFSV